MKLSKMAMIPLFLLGAALVANALPLAGTPWMLSEGGLARVETGGVSGHLIVNNAGPGDASLLIQQGASSAFFSIPKEAVSRFTIPAGAKVRICDRLDSEDYGSEGTYRFLKVLRTSP